jgi:hypothetical protein
MQPTQTHGHNLALWLTIAFLAGAAFMALVLMARNHGLKSEASWGCRRIPNTNMCEFRKDLLPKDSDTQQVQQPHPRYNRE